MSEQQNQTRDQHPEVRAALATAETIERLVEGNDALAAELESFREMVATLQADNSSLRQQIAHLSRERGHYALIVSTMTGHLEELGRATLAAIEAARPHAQLRHPPRYRPEPALRPVTGGEPIPAYLKKGPRTAEETRRAARS